MTGICDLNISTTTSMTYMGATNLKSLPGIRYFDNLMERIINSGNSTRAGMK
jgi:mevalonate pyrophosphate decarboxylase